MIEAKSKPILWSHVTPETARKTGVAYVRATLYPLAKRCMDVILAGVLLVLLSPFMALLALAIRLDSPGPAIFRQKRVGKFGREFVMYKFRSMFADADEGIHRRFATEYINGNGTHAAERSTSGRIIYKPNGDKRITRVGKWLRRTSLDELPQLLNVMKGEMSLVGPRPPVGYEVEQYSLWHLQRLAVLPGLTGLAQISGRSGLTFEKIARLDIEYIQTRSLAKDWEILLRTIPVVFRGKSTA